MEISFEDKNNTKSQITTTEIRKYFGNSKGNQKVVMETQTICKCINSNCM